MEAATGTRIVLIRHGESRSTVDRVVGGHQGCQGLSELGRAQAEALNERLLGTGELAATSVVFTSVLPRAIETAKLIAPALGDLAAEERCDFCEIHPGEADGLTWEEFGVRYAPTGPVRNPYRAWAPGGESWATFFARVGAALFEVASTHPGATVVIVCHGGVVEASFNAFGAQPVARAFDLVVENTSLTEWVLPPTARDNPEADERNAPHQRRWKLVRFNDAGHLGTTLRGAPHR